jgi:hypothetical protein
VIDPVIAVLLGYVLGVVVWRGRRGMRLPHWHRDPDWRLVGANIYEQCHCGARRTRVAYANLRGPVARDWPDMRDKHGVMRESSGWQRGDWRAPGHPRSL